MNKPLIKAKEGYIFRLKFDNSLWGNAISEGYIWQLNGKPLDEPIYANPEDWEEVIGINIDGIDYGVEDKDVTSYETLVSTLIRQKYTLDAELALSSNVRAYPEQYAEAEREFQDWRLKCKEAAKNYFNPVSNDLREEA